MLKLAYYNYNVIIFIFIFIFIYFNLSFIDLQPFKPFMLYYIMLLIDNVVVFTYKYNLFFISLNICTL